ncbi:MAG: hypothetical protein DI528_15680 [Shinella sp.]|nr:MAG: hypothetical protein DI528_15680 [Shinella sp.]
MNAFCASENCDAFIVFRSFPSRENAPESSNQIWSSLKGSDQIRSALLPALAAACRPGLGWKGQDRQKTRASACADLMLSTWLTERQ